MTRILGLAALAICLGSAASAETITVRSGDHADFSRIAMELPANEGWSFGRVGNGYALKLEGKQTLDLSRVWRAMGRSRIAGLRVDSYGALRITPACTPCHAVAFRSGPGTIVIDLRNGPAPENSKFEAPLALPYSAPPRRPDRMKPPVTSYDWTAIPKPEVAMPLAAALDPFRTAVVRQMAEGASRGLIEMVETPPPLPAGPPLPPNMQIGADEPASPWDSAINADGYKCLSPDQIAIETWGDDTKPVAYSLGPARAGLEGEFDRPDLDAARRAVRYYLYLGFGAEARQMAALYPLPEAERAIYDALAHVMDDEPAGDGPLTELAGCEGASALWGILARQTPAIGRVENTGAALQAFSGLPVHLRRQLAPKLVSRFEQRGNETSAHIARDSVLRATPDPDAATRLMVARMDDTSDSGLKRLIKEGGNGADDAVITLADRNLRRGEAIAPETLTALQGLLRERRGGTNEGDLQRLVILGLASNGNYDAAFNAQKAHPVTGTDLWAWLARSGDDEALLRHAVLPSTAKTTDVPQDTRLLLANRLIDLGFADSALIWLPQENAAASAAERLAKGRAYMGQRDGRSALTVIAGLEGPDADQIRSQAEAALAPPTPPTTAPPQNDTQQSAPTAGPLTRSRTLVLEADETRAKLEALLHPKTNTPQ
ncbi:hypothetical protein [Falsirhodobacter sp. alg1]|uniref:hypothetical protein n=1 Tax=Falsirhodobacter sp. alg1 TaxID=1472418 RepID=UPI0005EE6FE8|nr:hypothetical protein [Falsirhodobacter sp. alg1]